MGFIVDLAVGSKKASNTKKAAKRNLQYAEDARDYNRELLSPYLDLGTGAVGAQSDALGFNGQEGFDNSVNNFQSSPFATLPFNESLKTLEGGAANRGDLLSGQTLKDITNYSQNQTNNNFNRYFSALTGATGVGQRATGQSGNAESNFVNAATGASNQRANGQNQQVDAFGNAIDGVQSALASIFGLG